MPYPKRYRGRNAMRYIALYGRDRYNQRNSATSVYRTPGYVAPYSMGLTQAQRLRSENNRLRAQLMRAQNARIANERQNRAGPIYRQRRQRNRLPFGLDRSDMAEITREMNLATEREKADKRDEKMTRDDKTEQDAHDAMILPRLDAGGEPAARRRRPNPDEDDTEPFELL